MRDVTRSDHLRACVRFVSHRATHEVCVYCGLVRDTVPGRDHSSCLCSGIVCQYCRAGRIRRPATDTFRLDKGTFTHAPYFAGQLGCRWCRRLALRLEDDVPNPWPSVVRGPNVAAALRVISDAATSLAKAEYALSDELPPHDLVAVHGDVEAWHDLHLGWPPDGRPLYVGRALAEAGDLRFERRLRVATWSGPPERVDETLSELLVRWQPPLNTDIETPWNRWRADDSRSE